MDTEHITAFSVAAAFVLYVLDRVITLIRASRGREGSACEIAHQKQENCSERIIDSLAQQTVVLQKISETLTILLERTPRRSVTPTHTLEAVKEYEDLRRSARNAAALGDYTTPPIGGKTRR